MEQESSSPEEMVLLQLKDAISSNHELVRRAESKLDEWETQQGFFPLLARVCVADLTLQVNDEVRWIAAVYLKNGINKYWRRGARSELPAEQKQQIRQLLFTRFDAEPLPQIALQTAVIFAKIARIDYPRDWPDLVPGLLKRLQTVVQNAGAAVSNGPDVLSQHRVLLVLHQVIKALASRRMAPERRSFEDLACNIFAHLLSLWENYTEVFFTQLKESTPAAALSTLERAMLTLRVLRKLSIYGFSKPQNEPAAMRFLDQLFLRSKHSVESRYELLQLASATEPLVTTLEKFILKQMKTLNEYQQMHASSFEPYLPAALEYGFNQVFHEGACLIFTENVINFPNYAIHCINLIKNIVLCKFYNSGAKSNAERVPRVALTEFFTDERLTYICEKIVTHYFLLTQIELESWTEDPESFSLDDNSGDSWRFALRPSVETLYLTLFTHYRTQMISEVLKYVRKAQQIELNADSDLKDILLKDSIYNAAGLAAHYFFHDIDFNAWFREQLIAELRIETVNFRILRRRIIWLVGKWATVKFSRNMRPIAYEACLHLLRPEEDMSIRLAAANTISELIGEFEFAPEPFLPYLEPSFSSLFELLSAAVECDTKLTVLNIMSLIVEKMSDYIEPHAEKLIAYLPLLWDASIDYNMLRCSIICTLQQLVKAIRDIPEPMRPFLYNVIKLSVNLQEPSHIYLIEEGLSLWMAFLENSTALTPELLELCKNLLPIIEQSSENLRTVLVIIQAYILLDANVYLENYGQQFVAFCIRMFEDLRSEGIVSMLKVFELYIKANPSYGLELIRPALPYIFTQVYLNKEYPTLLGMYMMIVARVLLISQATFTTVVQEMTVPTPLEVILDVWITKMPLVDQIEKRKLFCLAFASVFADNPIMHERFPFIMQNMCETLEELMHEVENAGGQDENDSGTTTTSVGAGAGDVKPPIKYYDSLVLDEENLDSTSYCTLDDFDYKTYHYDRCRQLSLKDPVHKIALPEYIEWQLNTLRTQMGPNYQALLQTVQHEVLQKLSKYLKIN